MAEPSYPELLSKYQTQGLSTAEAQKKIHEQFPGLRRRYEAAASESKKPGMTVEQAAAALAEREAARSDKGGADYFTLARRIKAERGCTLTEAFVEVNRTQPELWRAMIRAANPGKNID